jgi:hypothetical protein
MARLILDPHRRCVVLSDHEREALRELERQFTAEPESAQLSVSHHAGRRYFGPSGMLLMTTMLFLGVIMLMAGSLTGALMFGTVTWLIWWAWLPSTDDTEQPP